MHSQKQTLSLSFVAAVVAVVLCWPAAALGHAGTHAGEVVRVGEITPAAAGVRVSSELGGIGSLRLEVTGDRVVDVLGTGGQPMLRVSKGGVLANTRSPDWYRSNEPLGIASVPATARADAGTTWTRVSVRPTWSWFDHRLHPAGATRSRAWRIPLLVDGRSAAVSGTIGRAPGALLARVDDEEPARGVAVSTVPQPVLAVRLRNGGRDPVEVLGHDGEVFARIGPRGTEVNVRSPLWVPAAQYRNRDLLTTTVDADAAPRFELIGREPELVWPDPRLAPARMPRRGPASGEARIGRWSIPLRRGGADVDITGAVLIAAPAAPGQRDGQAGEDPTSSGGGGLLWLAPLALAFLLLGGTLVRQRARPRA